MSLWRFVAWHELRCAGERFWFYAWRVSFVSKWNLRARQVSLFVYCLGSGKETWFLAPLAAALMAAPPGGSPHGCDFAFSVRHAVCMVMPSVAWKMSAVYVVLYADGPSGVVRTFPVSVATRGSLRAYNAAGMKDPFSRGLSRATATKELVLLGTRA